MTSEADAEAGAVPRVITADWLRDRLDWQRDLEWCAEEQIERFRRTFGESAELTRANLSRAAAVPLDLEWFARVVLPQRDWQDFQRDTEATRLESVRAIEPPLLEYWRAQDAARQNYGRVRATEATRLESERAMEPAWQDWERAAEAARQEFERVRAAARLDIERVRANVLADLLGLD